MVNGPGQPKMTEAKSISDNITNTLIDRGTSKAYTVSRLKRDRPDLFEKVVATKGNNRRLWTEPLIHE